MKQTVLSSKKFLPLLLIAALLAVLAPRSARFAYDYKKGGTWNYPTLFAPFDFPILKTNEQMMAEMDRASAVHIPYYNFSESATRECLKAAGQLDLGEFKSDIVAQLKTIMEKGVLADDALEEGAEVLYVQRDKRAVKVPATEVYKLSQARTALLTQLRAGIDWEPLDSLLLANSVYGLIVPNLEFDSQTTRAVNSQAAGRISPTMGSVSSGQLIVSEGEIITSDIAQILDSFKKEYENSVGVSGPGYLSLLGNILVALLLVSLLAFVIYYSNWKLYGDNRYYYLLFVFTIAASAILAISRWGPEWLYLTPLTLIALYMQAFVRGRVIIPVYMVSLLPLLIYSDHGPAVFIIFLCGGVLSIYCFKYLGRGWRQFLLALINFAVMALAYIALRLVGAVSGILFQDLLKILGASLLAVLGYPLIYLFEKIFNLVSDSRLSELADTSSPLLRELEQKAPGTFQHSLQVMNMADAAARAIDANPLLLRVGALYHDIGKMENPQCFIENESLLNKPEDQKYHTGLTPMQSAEDIIKHVGDGVELARKHHLPQIVVDFIRTHHGTSLTGYFWSKYISGKDADATNRAPFTYPGPAPVSKEQIILMLCDSIEAASRTLAEYTPEAYSEFVERIVQGKMDGGQFANSDISIKELGDVKEAIKTYLAQMHHGRVVYPATRKKFLNLK
ncbi:MAG: HDIG domain-containing protein [Bacteroidales bacterium]|nr:HDIG domain-containing protein [Bacteroidales bacterium]